MEKSILENFSDKQLIKFMRYVLPILGDYTNNDLIDFSYELYNDNKYKKIAAPIGGNLSRLDIEYIYYVINNNKNFDGETIDRPVLENFGVNYIERSRQVIYTTYSGEIPTYASKYIDDGYLFDLKSEDEIDPYSWDYETEETDSDFIDDEWDY
jgi:hypothetical protein